MKINCRGLLISFVSFLILSALVLLTLGLTVLLSPYDITPYVPKTSVSSRPRDTVTIIIDAGHGGEDGGAVGVGGVVEKDLNLDIALRLSDMLRASGIKVIMTRTEDILLYDRNVDYMGRKKILDLRARMEVCQKTPNAIFVSIHMNSFPLEKYSGLQVWCAPDSPDSLSLASSIQSAVRKTLQPENDRRVKTAGSNIYLIHDNPGTAVLIECGFLSNTEECAKLAREEYRKELSFIIFSAIVEHINDTERS